VIDQLLDLRAKAAPLRSQNDDQVALKELVRHGVETFGSIGISSNHPETLIFQITDRARKITHARDGQPLDRARARPGKSRAEGWRSPSGQQQTTGARPFGHPGQGADVLGIFDAIEGDDPTSSGRSWPAQLREFDLGQRTGFENDTLRIPRLSRSQILSTGMPHGDPCIARQLESFGDLGTLLRARHYRKTDQAAAPSAHRLDDAVDPVELLALSRARPRATATTSRRLLAPALLLALHDAPIDSGSGREARDDGSEVELSAQILEGVEVDLRVVDTRVVAQLELEIGDDLAERRPNVSLPLAGVAQRPLE